ncbi:MARTX multifunctional-autoprocessing repeats-in-toxin holotoxin RtxA [Xenorhabdus hominickii]|uniref:Autotransporter adhesin n=1 Tax=Xenorhabdus hominickii TaxID=351679 RepID=A0A2G0QAF9_XENHO|nr:MARTX multifunctional-autoprocessing repeats-in-toxin holotoxin RtxA [Xenorhabdus hominickii]AOM40843.1 RTX toxin [Xenorhabdus hominickii]PHM56198.1 Autotransporter adhesin [Xenorhabdus hominickii]
MGKSSNRSTEYFFTGRYEDDNDGNTIHAIGVGGVINAYGGNDYIVVASVAATVNTTWGHDTVVGGAGYLNINDTSGSLTVKGGSGYTSINKTQSGTIEFAGAAGGLKINHAGDNGAINYSGVSGYNSITRKGVQGNIRFEGAGAYNSLYSDVKHGDIYFAGAGGYNKIIRKGSASDFSGEGMEYAKAEDIVLSNATMNGSWIGSDHQVTGVKSTREPNTYLFAFADDDYTKINKVQLCNDPETGKLIYHSTSWYKEGNHLKGLEKQEISADRGFVDVNTDGAYTLSNLTVENQQAFTIQAVKEKLTENEWVAYGDGIQINAADIILSDAKLGGYAVYGDGTTVDVTAVKSNRTPNTYVYAKKLGIYTKIVVVELKNDPATGILQYIARPWYKEGDYTTNLANEIISAANGYNAMETGGYSLSNLHYQAPTVNITSERVAKISEYSEQALFKSENDGGESSGDVRFEGAGGGNVIKSNVTRGNVYFNGAGIANVIEHSSEFGNTEFNGAGGANVIVKKGQEGNLIFNGAGIANVLLHQGKRGDMEVNAGGAANVLVRVGDGRYLAHLLAVGNISIHKGNGDSRISMGGGFNTHTQIGHGNAFWSGVGGVNVLTQVGKGNVSSILLGGANVLTKNGEGNLESAMFGGANVITHISNNDASYSGSSNTAAITLGGANILTKKGKGDVQAVMGGGANVLTHIGNGKTTGIMLGGANILTKVGNGDTTGIMLGLGNVLTHVGDGQTLGVMAAAGNIFTKVGDGTTIAAMIGAGNIFTHVGDGNALALMVGAGNIFTKVGNGDALALMLSLGNVFTHIGDGTSVALMIAKGNIATKAGNGNALSAMIGKGNIFTQIGHGSTFAAMIGGANVLTKVGNGLTAALMVGKANIYTHVGDGTSIGLFAGTANVMTKVGNGTTLSAMFGEANIMTHIGNGLTGVLALGKANIVTKVGNNFMGVVAASEANVITHVGDGTTAALLSGKGNILTKVGNGTTVGLLISKIGNIMTHVGDGTTVGFAKGEANIITKVGGGLGINAVWGKANIVTHYGDGDRYNFAKGEANIVTKIGDGQEITIVQGQANIVTHVGNGDDYTGAWGNANVITKVGDGRNVVLAKGDANIVTQIGNGDSLNALLSQGNVVTKVGDGIQVTAAKGKGNITTTVGNGLSVTAVHGDLNINTKVGDGVSVNVAWGKFNVNTRVGNGLNVSVMKGQGNANIRVGDGLNINASYARNNVAIQVGNGDFYSLAVAESNTESNKLGALFDNVKQTLLGSAGSQGISYLVNGDEANTSGSHKGHGAIDLPEVSSLNGLKLTEIDEVTSDLKNSLQGSVTGVETPDIDAIQNSLGNEKRLSSTHARNLIVNGDFERGAEGWKFSNGIEADFSAESYGLSKKGHGERVSELDTDKNTGIYQYINDLSAGESITVNFDFARRANISADNGMEVLWNGKVVFSASAGNVEWKNETLTLTAQAGRNQLEFKGTGESDGLGYILDNVVAKSMLSGSEITNYAKQDKTAQNALQDKEKAEADRQRLEQERDKQQAAISGTQAQLENTDLDALNASGQSQRDAINDESKAVTEELMAKVKGLEALDRHATHDGPSGEQWRDQFAGGFLGSLQTKLDSAKETAQQQLARSQQASSGRLEEIKNAVAKSDAGVLKGEQDRQQSQQNIAEARASIESREQEAIARMKQAEQAERAGKSAAQKAEQRGQDEVSAAEMKTAQVQSNAQSAKLDDKYKPNRINATNHVPSHNVHDSIGAGAHSGNGFGEFGRDRAGNSDIDLESTTETDSEFNVELQYLNEDLNELTNAKEALGRLQINAGVRTKKSNTQNQHAETSLIPVSGETFANKFVNNAAGEPTELIRNIPKISGLDLSGLKALGDAETQSVNINTTDINTVDSNTTESSAAVNRAQKVADVYRWLDSDNDLATENYIPVPGFERVDADIPDNLRQKMVTFVEGYLNGAENSVPKDQISSLAKLFVDATIDYDWDKRVEFVSRLEHYGYSFEPVHGDKSIVSFWSGRNFKQYRSILDAAQTDGKKVVYDIDVKGNFFAIELNKTLMRWGGIYLDSDIAEQHALQSVINASARSNTGFWSSLYATGSRDDVYVIAEGGLRLGNYFWNVELPVLRQLQREGLVGEIRLLDKAAKEYQGVPSELIGRRLTEAGVAVKARFDSLSFEKQEKLLASNPDGYKPDTLIDLDIKTSAIDNLLNQALPFYGLRTERNLLVREADGEGFEVRPWPGNRDNGFKTIIVEDPDDKAQIKAIERFILANYDDYGQLPDALYLVEERIISHEHGRTRILAEKVDGHWNYQPKTDLMSAGELQDAAYVKGKILGDSYQNVLDALKSYENSLQNSQDYDLEAVEKLTHLRHQVNGYLLGHPNSERVPVLENLLSQINVRMDESLALAESTVASAGKGSFSDLYNTLGNANLKDSKHLYIDEQGNFVTRGKSNIEIAAKAESAEKAVEQIKAAVTKEYGQSVSDAVFSDLTSHKLSKDGKGIDVSGLRKLHQAIEQQLSPVSATLFVWKPSDHSRLGHAALQIGQGRVEINVENAGDFNEKNYVSWWPKGSKSTNISRIFDVSTPDNPNVKIRWRDLSQPAGQSESLELDVASEEKDNFGLQDGTRKLKKFIEKLQAAKGVDAKFEDISEGFAMAALANPSLLQSAGIPEHISRPFLQQWEDSSVDMLEVGKNFAEALRIAAKQQTPELTEKRITNVIRQFAEHELSNIQDFKASEGDSGRVFRINLAGLDVAAMHAEWNKISQNPDTRYQLLTDNCSSIVARVLKAGGSDKVIGHTWRPHFGVWTPTELFNYGQALQEAQVEITTKKHNRIVGNDLTTPGHAENKDKLLEKVAIDNDGTPPRDREPFNPVTRFLNNELYGAKDVRRKVNEDTQILLDYAVSNGTADKVTLRGEAGRLTGYYHSAKQETEAATAQESTKKIVLFIHGSGSSVEEQAGAIQSHYQKQGVDLLAVNLRGYGSSDGFPSEQGVYHDARTMFHYLVNDRGIKPENIIIHGYSMGGAIAADLARYAERNGQAVSGLLLDRPIPSMTKAITAHEVPNPAGITGVLAKSINGQFSVEKNLQGISKQTPIMLLTDNEGLGNEGEKLRAKLVVAGYQVSGEQTFYGHEASSRLMSQYANQIVSTLSEPQTNESEILKGIKSDLKRYGEALQPQADSLGKKPKDIRTTKDFLAGYKQGNAERTVDGFRSDMNIKQLVDLLVKNNWSAEQKGALAWEIESRALKITFQPKSEKFNRLFRDIASTGVSDIKASEQLAPQLLLLNLSNDGFGGRCDPLSKLVLVAKQLENDGQNGVARQLLEKMYSAAAVLSNPDLYSETERANANKLLGSLAALHAMNPMTDTSIKVWKEKLEGEKSLTVDGVIQKITARSSEGKPILLELDAPGHAMAAWAKGTGENRVYGFYDPNAGIVEFSSAEKFGAYVTRFFGGPDLNMAQSYKLPKNAAGEIVFARVVVIDGDVLATYRPRHADKITMRDMLELPVFDDTPIKKPVEINAADGVKKPLSDNALENHVRVNNQNVDSWVNVEVKPQSENSDSRFSGQIIIQTENDPVVAQSSANLAGKHPDSSVIVQLDASGKYRVVYGDPAALSEKLKSEKLQPGKLRWQVVGHGREDTAYNHTRMSGYSAVELALMLRQFNTDFKQVGAPEHISLVGCSLIRDDSRDGFARHFISELDSRGIRTAVSARSSEVAVDSVGRKYTRDAQEQWVNKLTDNKIVLGWNDKGEVESHFERIRRGISENDITLSRVGQTDIDAKVKGAIADNTEIFHAPKRSENVDDHSSATSSSVASSSKKHLSYSGNIQVQVGDGEFNAINWGTTNVGIKVGAGGFKSLAFGDNNVMVHVGNGDSKHSVNIAGYQALEGAQLFVGNRNVSFNLGRSNDLIVMLEKSIPTPPLINPFDGAARISGALQNIAGSWSSPDWLTAQNQQWTLEGAKKFVSDLSGLDLTSSVKYETLTALNSENDRSSRGLKSDLDSTLNKKYNQWLSGEGNTPEMGQISRAEKFRQMNEKLAFNFAVGGQGADIQVTSGNWNFMFGDNIQSILDTNLGSLFGLMTQEYTATGMAKTTFTFSPTDLPRQIKNKLLGKLAGVSADTTLADIFGVDYTANGTIVSRSNQPVDGVAILRDMMEIIGEFSGDQLQAFTDPAKLLDSLKAGLNTGVDGVKSFAESHGLKAKAPDDSQEGKVSLNGKRDAIKEQEIENAQSERAFGFNSLNLPNLFATLLNQDKQAEMKSLVTNLKDNLTADLLNIQDKTFDFLRSSGHLQGDGDIHVSFGNYNFNWGGDGKDLGAYLGDNNNFWGGRGNDVFYSVGTSNIFSGGKGDDVGVLMGRENMMFGGAGNDVAVLAGRINYAYMGDGDDQIFAFGENGVIDGGKGRDYIVASGNFNSIDAGEDQDYVVTIGNNNQVDLGAGDDFATVFGNYNRIDGNAGNNSIKLVGYHAVINGGTGNDHMIADVISKFSQFNGGSGDNLLVLGGYQNRFKGGMGVNSYVVSGNVIDNVVENIKQGDKIIFNEINWQNLWFQRSGYDLVLLTHRDIKDTSVQGQFEAMGSVTFNDYFNGNRADIVTQMGGKDAQGEREYTALSANAVDSLVQAMSGFAPNMGGSGFIDSLDSQTKATIITAWSDTTNGKSKLA